jgi:hypothetical protein
MSGSAPDIHTARLGKRNMINNQSWDLTSQDPTPEQRFRAARTIAHHARDATELAELLDMLGLSPEEGRRRY